MTLLKKELWYCLLCAFRFDITPNLILQYYSIWFRCTHVVFTMFVYVRQDPFGDHLKLMMSMIHEFMPSTVSADLRQKGTQEYESDVVDLHKTG